MILGIFLLKDVLTHYALSTTITVKKLIQKIRIIELQNNIMKHLLFFRD